MQSVGRADPPTEQLDQLIETELALTGLITQWLETDHTPLELGLAEHECVDGTALVGALELALEAAATAVGQESEPGQCITQSLGEQRGLGLGLLADRDQIGMDRWLAGMPRQAEQLDEPLQPEAKPTAGVARPPSCSTRPS